MGLDAVGHRHLDRLDGANPGHGQGATEDRGGRGPDVGAVAIQVAGHPSRQRQRVPERAAPALLSGAPHRVLPRSTLPPQRQPACGAEELASGAPPDWLSAIGHASSVEVARLPLYRVAATLQQLLPAGDEADRQGASWGADAQRYDQPKTPLRPVLDSGAADADKITSLVELYTTVSPLTLKRRIDRRLSAMPSSLEVAEVPDQGCP
jgi:hypothetical protein